MKQSSEAHYSLFRTDSEGYTQEVIFTPEGSMVSIYYSTMGDDNLKRTEDARVIYRELKSAGWAA